jgi:3-phenylpropionate/trans-cinnamate dioxygenase ferredoxin component
MGLFKSWKLVADVTEFEDTDRKQYFLENGKEVGLFKIDGEFLAVHNECTHSRASMIGGRVENGEIECPLHGARFDLRTGAVRAPPALTPLTTWPVKVEGGKIYIKA